MSQLSEEEIFQEIGKIIQRFGLYQCDDCARAIFQWLKVFDNLSVEGMTREDWLNDFDCPSHQFTLTELDSLS